MSTEAGAIQGGYEEYYTDYRKLFRWWPGNHDNFIGFNVSPSDIRKLRASGSSLHYPKCKSKMTDWRPVWPDDPVRFLFKHGHNWQSFNCDEGFGVGYLVTALLTFCELAGKGEQAKELEDCYDKNRKIREDYRRAVFQELLQFAKRTSGLVRTPCVIAQAHTHEPYLEDMTYAYSEWRRTGEATLDQPHNLDILAMSGLLPIDL